jgi:SpoVK/Ycf46/Vps4 family AAA+-type ATPase
LTFFANIIEGFSGSDITALAKDAAMGPFQASLINIRPSVSKQGLKKFEDWAKEFGERGG